MNQQAGTYNLVIQDNNGKPQYIKLQKGQSASRLIKADGKTVRTIVGHKPGAVAQVVTSSGNVIQGTSMLRTVSLTGKPARQFVTIPPNQMPKLQERSATVIASPSPKVVATSSRPMTSVGDRSLKREMSIDFATDGPSSNKRRKAEKGGKGLRHFSMKVCEKVKKKGLTSYNEVADELVAEFTDPKHIPNSVDQQYDQKNIRRRVYDALNVLMAMNIISKEKKEIRWLGLPMTTAQENTSLVSEKKRIADRIALKTQQLNELLIQQISYKNLMQRNLENEKNRGPPPPNSAIQLPFIVVNSDRKTVIDCSITNDKTEYLFVFNDKFEIKDDFEVLKQIGLTHGLDTGNISKANLEKVKMLVPKCMEKYIEKMAKAKPVSTNSYDGDTDPDQAGPSSDGFPQEDDSNAEDDTDDESNISTDLETN